MTGVPWRILLFIRIRAGNLSVHARRTSLLDVVRKRNTWSMPTEGSVEKERKIVPDARNLQYIQGERVLRERRSIIERNIKRGRMAGGESEGLVLSEVYAQESLYLALQKEGDKTCIRKRS